MRETTQLDLARRLSELWAENEQDMGEQAAYHVSCEQLGIDPDEGYGLLALLNQDEVKDARKTP